MIYLQSKIMIDELYPYYLNQEEPQKSCLLAGSRSRMKILRINPTEDLPVNLIESLLNGALDLYRNGIIKIKP